MTRKRLITGLLAVAVIGVAAFFLSQPKRGSVEWHLREYRAALDRWHGKKSVVKSAIDAFRQWRRPSPVIITDADVVAQEDALIRLGYLERREFTVTNISAELAVPTVGRAAMTAIPGMCRISGGPRPGVVTVTARRGDISKWEELIRKADVPAKKDEKK